METPTTPLGQPYQDLDALPLHPTGTAMLRRAGSVVCRLCGAAMDLRLVRPEEREELRYCWGVHLCSFLGVGIC